MMNTTCVSVILLLVLGSFACTKEVNHMVRIRIANHASFPVTDAVLGSEQYGTLQPGQTSEYYSFANLTYTPTLNFYEDTTLVQLLIGFCGTGLPQSEPSYLENGDYLYTIISDTSAYYGCTYSFIKENN